MSKDSFIGTLVVAFVLCVVCSIGVSSVAVGLKPTQERNKSLDQKKNILVAGGLYQPGDSIEEKFQKIDVRYVDLKTGQYTQVDPKYDMKKAAKDPQQSIRIPIDKDLGKNKTRPKVMPVYLVKSGDQLERVIIPVYGKGLWSTLYGFLSLDKDLNSVMGLEFYEHAETPGLGGEVDNPNWKDHWKGGKKKLYDSNGKLAIEVIKGRVDPRSSKAKHQVDGLSGATITARGVKDLLRYWLSDHGYQPYLQQLKTRG